MTYVLAFDQGTTSSRAIVFDEAGSVVALQQREYQQYFPQSGWVEHDANEIWQSQLAVAEEVLAEAKLKPQDVAALGITNQRETSVVWERATGKPIYRAIVWQDRRTASKCGELRAAGHEQMIREKTGLLLDPYFSGTKFAWILDHVDGARKRAEAGELACGTIDSWLIYNLTGGKLHITDVSNASRTLLLDINRCEWDDELLNTLNVPRAMLPEVRSSSETYGDASACEALNNIPIAGIAGDQQAALFGQACYESGLAKNTYGTGCFALVNVGDQALASQNKLLTTVAWRIGNRTDYALEGSVFVGGAVVRWLRDELKLIKTSAEVGELAKSVPDSGGVYLVPAFAGLGAPHWDPYARGAIVGMTLGTNAAHIARAAVDSIALQTADLIDAMRLDSNSPIAELRVDGGASVNDGLLQYQADILQVPVVRPKVTETTALGAAYLAGLATGVWKDRNEIERKWQVDRRFEPQMPADRAEAIRLRWNDAVERAKNWAQE